MTSPTGSSRPYRPKVSAVCAGSSRTWAHRSSLSAGPQTLNLAISGLTSPSASAAGSIPPRVMMDHLYSAAFPRHAGLQTPPSRHSVRVPHCVLQRSKAPSQASASEDATGRDMLGFRGWNRTQPDRTGRPHNRTARNRRSEVRILSGALRKPPQVGGFLVLGGFLVPSMFSGHVLQLDRPGPLSLADPLLDAVAFYTSSTTRPMLRRCCRWRSASTASSKL